MSKSKRDMRVPVVFFNRLPAGDNPNPYLSQRADVGDMLLIGAVTQKQFGKQVRALQDHLGVAKAARG